MLETFGDNTQRQSLNARDRLIAVLAVAEYARKGRHFSKPASVVLAFKLDCERHGANVPSVGLANKRLHPMAATPRDG